MTVCDYIVTNLADCQSVSGTRNRSFNGPTTFSSPLSPLNLKIEAQPVSETVGFLQPEAMGSVKNFIQDCVKKIR